MRFYTPASGEIRIDGNLMQALNPNWIRNNITLLEQRSVLFNDSVFQNIAFGGTSHGDIRPEDLEEAIELAMLQDTIDSLPKGINTCVGPGGSFLSGGQRQRVAIARAKLRDTPILILDEPTSALDHTNRVAIMKAIREWRAGKTTIIITHDMSHINNEDFLYILEDGSIVLSGYRQQVEQLSCSEKYFRMAAKCNKDPSQPESILVNKGLESDASLGDLELSRPQRVRRNQPHTWARHRLSHSYGSAPWEDSVKKLALRGPSTVGLTEDVQIPQSERRSFLGVLKASHFSHNKDSGRAEIPTKEFEMDKFNGSGSGSGTDSMNHVPKSSYLSIGLPRRASSIMHPIKHREVKKEEMTLSHIMGSIVPSLTSRQRVVLFLGIASCLIHASATPVFSLCMSELFTTFHAGNNNSKLAMKWSLAVLGISFGDGLASFFMHYCLEYCGEAWMDTLRKQAFQRVLDQPRAWFEQDGNRAHRITAYLDQNGEDMRNLLGRFAGFVIVAVAIMVMAVIWSLIVCWKLTLVALACGPVIYTITRGFEGVNGSWERRCNEVTSTTTDVFTETFSEIRTVRTLKLEGYFHRKQTTAISRCLNIGLKRAAYTGLMFGMVESTVIFASGKTGFSGVASWTDIDTALIFYYGAILAASEFTVDEVMQVFSLLLFSIGYAAQILSWSQ
jgi:ATP-binding cassette subfamily B (MDR/TAP) protein 1